MDNLKHLLSRKESRDLLKRFYQVLEQQSRAKKRNYEEKRLEKRRGKLGGGENGFLNVGERPHRQRS